MSVFLNARNVRRLIQTEINRSCCQIKIAGNVGNITANIENNISIIIRIEYVVSADNDNVNSVWLKLSQIAQISDVKRNIELAQKSLDYNLVKVSVSNLEKKLKIHYLRHGC